MRWAREKLWSISGRGMARVRGIDLVGWRGGGCVEGKRIGVED